MNPEVIHTNAFARDAARLIEETGAEAIAERGVFRLALSGGRTPAAVYQELAATSTLPWDALRITFGDERCVPPEDEQSNYRMARRTLFDAVPIPRENIFRLCGELPPTEGARAYEADLARLAADFGEPIYRHDLLLLGMGPDGHTASLFPETGALQEQTRHVVENFVPKFESWRLTFTYPLINAARRVCFMVEGDEKRAVVDEILAGGSSYPAAKVAPADGRLTWMLGW